MKAPQLFCFGHRGAAGYEPENTLRAVRKALELDTPGVEVDVQLAEGHLVVIHDDTLDRTTNGTGLVAETAFDELRALDAGQGEQIPTLEEVFETVGRRAVINVELKGPGTAAPVMQLIDRYIRERGWSTEDFLISSFDHAQLQAAKQLLPEIRVGALITNMPPRLVALAEQMDAWSLHLGKRSVSPELVADAHRRGLKVFVYTINRPSDIAALGLLGVDGVFSDYPDRVMAFSRD